MFGHPEPLSAPMASVESIQKILIETLWCKNDAIKARGYASHARCATVEWQTHVDP